MAPFIIGKSSIRCENSGDRREELFLTIAEQSPGRAGLAVLKDEYGEYTLQKRDGLLFDDHQKTYISGEKAGTVQKLGFFEWIREVNKRDKKYGYFDWKADWVPGEVPAIIIPS